MKKKLNFELNKNKSIWKMDCEERVDTCTSKAQCYEGTAGKVRMPEVLRWALTCIASSMKCHGEFSRV